MAISSQVNSRTFVATGTAAPVSIAFKWALASDLIVTRLVAGEGSADDGGPLTMGSAYAIGGDGRANPPTGFLTEIALEAGRTYRIERATDALQKYEPRMAVAGNAGAMENQLDDMVMAHQDVRRDLADTVTRSWMVPRGEQGGVLPSAAVRAGKFRAWDAGGDEVAASGFGSDPALRTDFADPLNGDKLAVTIQDGANMRPRTVRQSLNDVVSLFGIDGIDETGAADSSAGLVAAIGDGRALRFPQGVVAIDTDLEVAATTFEMIGDGKGSVLDFSGGGSLLLKADPVAMPALSADHAGGGNVIGFAAAHGLVKGDVFRLYNPTDFSFAPYREEYREGYAFRVAKVNSPTEVVIYGTIPRALVKANLQCWKFPGGAIKLSNFRIIPSAAGTQPIRIDGFQGVDLSDLIADDGAADTAIEVTRCYDVRLIGARATVSAGNSYPFVVANSQKVLALGCALYSIRHAVALGGGDYTACIPTADVLVSHCTLLNDATLGVPASDAHGSCDGVTYSHCTMDFGAGVGGRNISLLYNRISGCPPSVNAAGHCVYGSEIVGGLYRFVGNEFVTWGNGSSFGLVQLSAANRVEDLRIEGDGNRFVNRGSSSGTVNMWRIEVGAAAGTKRLDINLGSIVYRAANAALRVLMISGTADVSALMTVAIDDLDAPSGTGLLGASNAANYAAPKRLPAQSGQVTLSCASGAASIISGFISYRYPYPVAPAAFCTGAGSIVGNRYPSGHNFVVEATRIRPMLHSGDDTNWTASGDRVASWFVGFKDF
jgi:hypothetical protein